MRAKTGRRSTRALVVSGVLAALACGARAQAQETITTNDGGTLPNVKVERVEGDSALLLVPMTDLSPESRKRLGLRTHEEQAAFEARLSALASDWREIHSDPNFLSWLKEHDDAYPTDRAALMTKAMREGDATQVAKLMYTWKAIRAAVEQERVDREAVEAKVRRDRLWADAHPWWTQENYRRMAALAEERGWALDRFKEAILTGDVPRLAATGKLSQKEKDAVAEMAEAGFRAHVDRGELLKWRMDADAGPREFYNVIERLKKQEALALREEQWRNEAVKRLDGPSHQVTVASPDGTPTTKDSARLTAEERARYITRYIAEQDAVWQREDHWRGEAMREMAASNHEVRFLGPDAKLIRRDSWRLTPEERELYIARYVEDHERLRQAAAAKSLEGPNHEVTFIAPDGTTVTKDSSQLTPAERAHYLRQYVAGAAAVRPEEPARTLPPPRREPPAASAAAATSATPEPAHLTRESSTLTAETRANYVRRYVDEHEMIRQREDRWRDEAARILAGPAREISFLGADGKLTTRDSGRLEIEDKALYLKYYLEEREALRRDQAVKNLAGPDHQVNFLQPDGTAVKKNSLSLTPEERAFFIAQYAEEHN